MQNVIVIVIVVLAVAYLFRAFFRSSRKEAPSCGCGCASCGSETVCPADETGQDKTQS
jgi:uncharacterized membrane protein YadS